MLTLPSSTGAQQQLQQLTEKNRQLQDEVDKWQAYFASQSAVVKTNPPPAPDSFTPQTVASTPSPRPTPAIQKPPVASPRTHTVAAGETPASIARKAGVSLNALLAANPGLQPTHLRVGDVIKLPPP